SRIAQFLSIGSEMVVPCQPRNGPSLLRAAQRRTMSRPFNPEQERKSPVQVMLAFRRDLFDTNRIASCWRRLLSGKVSPGLAAPKWKYPEIGESCRKRENGHSAFLPCQVV